MIGVLSSLNYEQIAIFGLQGILVATIILVLFHVRKYIGIGVLFVFLGVMQSMQVYLASTVYFEVAPGFIASPGSSVLFVATLFAILLIYIKEDASEIRKIVYALLIANVVISLLMFSFGWNITDSQTYNPYDLPVELFNNNAWILIPGSVVLFLDAVLIIVVYEFCARYLKNVFFQILIAMVIVVSFDASVFPLSAFWGSDKLDTIILSGLIAKVCFAVFYTIIFATYLKYFSSNEVDARLFNLKDVFAPLSYRQKYEHAQEGILKATKEARWNQSKYKTLTDISPVGIFHASLAGELTFVNDRLCEIFNLTTEEILGLGWQVAVHRHDLEAIKKSWHEALSKNEPGRAEFRILWKDGSLRWLLGHIVPETNNDFEKAGYVGTVTDITELKAIQQEQTSLRIQAEKSDQLKSAFLANMSHEIRTPMNGILGFSNLLKEPRLSGEKKLKYIHIIEESGSRMLSIIDNLINISKIESGAIETQFNETNIKKVLKDVHDVLSIEADKKKLTLNIQCDNDDASDMYLVDSEKLYGILTNLVKNAIKFTDEGSVTFGYKRVSNQLKFFVKDTGIGIPENRLNAIFKRFIQADVMDTMARQGAGLGLTIAKAYVEMLGGEIWVESTVMKGTSFYFTIPSQPKLVPEKIVKGPFGMELKVCEKAAETRKLKILLVEDDETSQQLMLIKLKKYSSEILCAKTAEEVLKICHAHPDLDLILMDIQLPGTNGYVLTKEIRKFNASVVIIAQTAFALAGDREKALEAGCNDHVTKPINMPLLANIVFSHFATKPVSKESI